MQIRVGAESAAFYRSVSLTPAAARVCPLECCFVELSFLPVKQFRLVIQSRERGTRADGPQTPESLAHTEEPDQPGAPALS